MKFNHKCARDTDETIDRNVILSVRKILTKQSNEMQSKSGLDTNEIIQ